MHSPSFFVPEGKFKSHKSRLHVETTLWPHPSHSKNKGTYLSFTQATSGKRGCLPCSPHRASSCHSPLTPSWFLCGIISLLIRTRDFFGGGVQGALILMSAGQPQILTWKNFERHSVFMKKIILLLGKGWEKVAYYNSVLPLWKTAKNPFLDNCAEKPLQNCRSLNLCPFMATQRDSLRTKWDTVFVFLDSKVIFLSLRGDSPQMLANPLHCRNKSGDSAILCWVKNQILSNNSKAS